MNSETLRLTSSWEEEPRFHPRACFHLGPCLYPNMCLHPNLHLPQNLCNAASIVSSPTPPQLTWGEIMDALDAELEESEKHKEQKGVELFIRGLDSTIDEQHLYKKFLKFGNIISAKRHFSSRSYCGHYGNRCARAGLSFAKLWCCDVKDSCEDLCFISVLKVAGSCRSKPTSSSSLRTLHLNTSPESAQ
ncbi:hypothetical protein Q7C36_001482 [Tachysurus vachellii]|uniref:RRM domain-containing protein n=1 Tax=Tachysurus vachellii TaxID=175792 RepID=A0AA88P138_TACVA|nr:hypothetical protein Q7C36_001482 [Tachysurus vachellii]